MKKSFKYIFMAAVAVSLSACSDDEPNVNPDGSEVLEDGTILTDHAAFTIGLEGMYNTNPQAARSAIMSTEHKYWDDKESGFMLSATYVEPDKTPLASRAEHLDNGYAWKFNEWYKSVGVMVNAYYDKGGVEQEWIKEKPFRRNDDGIWRPDQRWYWPRGASKFTLYAWTPLRDEYRDRDNKENFDDNNKIGFGQWYDGTTPYLWYRTAKYSADQQDIMVAKREMWPSSDGNGNSLQVDGNPVSAKQMTFNHILGGLRFRIAKRPGRPNINRFDLYQIPYRTGDYNMRTGEWVNKRDRFDAWTAWSGDTSTPGRSNWTNFWVQQHTYNDVMPEDRTFMLIPQTFDQNTFLRIFWTDGHSTDVNLNGVEIQAGRMLYIDIQEPSIFVEGFKSFRETGNGNEWPMPNRGDWGNGAPEYFRLYEDANGNYYRNTNSIWWDWHLPDNDWEDENAWNNNDRRYFGHRLAFNILSRVYKDGNNWGDGNIFYNPIDMREKFFIGKRAPKEPLRYKEFHEGNNHREAYLKDSRWNADPQAWDVSNNTAPWYCLGGELFMTIRPDRDAWGNYPDWGGTGSIEFDPRSTGRAPINWPRRICVAGSVNQFAFLQVRPYDAGWTDISNDELNNKSYLWDNRSTRNHPLGLVDNELGIYEGYINVNQWTPNLSDNMDYCILPGWRGCGSVMFYTSSLHGSLGSKNYSQADEYESRLGVVGNISFNGIENSYSGKVNNFGHTYTGSYMKMPLGNYFVRINLTDNTFEFERKGDYGTTHFKAFRYPFNQIRNYWYDYITYGSQNWNYPNEGTFWYKYAYDWVQGISEWFAPGCYVYHSDYIGKYDPETAP